jgi:hypothetical protein
LKTKIKRKGKKKEKKLTLGKGGRVEKKNTKTNNFKNKIF